MATSKLWPGENSEVFAINQEWCPGQLLEESFKEISSFQNKLDIFVADELLSWDTWYVYSWPVIDEYLPNEIEMIVSPLAIEST